MAFRLVFGHLQGSETIQISQHSLRKRRVETGAQRLLRHPRGQRNLAEAGLADLVEVRVGDARETLSDLVEPIDLLFLDGLNDLYLPLQRALEPRLRRGALVAADRPRRSRYSSYVRDPGNGYASTLLAGDLELSVRVG